MPKTSIRPSRGDEAVGWLTKDPPSVTQSSVCHVPLEMNRTQMALSVPRAKTKVVGGVANWAEARIWGQTVPWHAESWLLGDEEEGKVVGVPNAGWGWEGVVVGGETCPALDGSDLVISGFC